MPGNFRDTAEGETGHAHGHLDYLKKLLVIQQLVKPMGDTSGESRSLPLRVKRTSTLRCIPGMAKAAREEGFSEIADWFETLAKAEKSHAGRFQSLLDDIS